MAAGYINGYEDGTVKTKGFITRQEASKILVIASNFQGEEYENLFNFKDKNQIGNWAMDYVNIMVNRGYIIGYDDGNFGPQRNISRAETAKILSLIYNDIVKENDEKPEEKPEEPKITLRNNLNN